MKKATRSASPRIDALMMPQIEAFHGHMANESTLPGELWEIEPDFGKGYYWNYIIDDIMVVSLCELEFYEQFSFAYEVPDFFCIGKYNKNMSSYFHSLVRPQLFEGVLGYVWKHKRFSETVKENSPLQTASMCLLPEAMHRISRHFKVGPLVLASAISELDGMQMVPGLSDLLDSLFTIRPGKTAARAYYESKIVEACALLVDWWLLKQEESEKPIRPADQTAINVTLEYIQENLEKHITLNDLCRLSCMSASKLTVLFKQTKQKSPIEYARDAKLDYACRLLIEDSASIHEISTRLGFMHQGSFSDAFKARYGIAPRTYRRTHASQSTLPGSITRYSTNQNLMQKETSHEVGHNKAVLNSPEGVYP